MIPDLTQKFIPQRLIIFIDGGVNYVNKHKRWNRNRYSYLEKTTESGMLQRLGSQQKQDGICM